MPRQITRADTDLLARLRGTAITWHLQDGAPPRLQNGIGWDHPIVNCVVFTVGRRHGGSLAERLGLGARYPDQKGGREFWIARDPRNGIFMLSSPDHVYTTYKRETLSMGPISSEHMVIDESITIPPERFSTFEDALDAGVRKAAQKNATTHRESVPFGYTPFTPPAAPAEPRPAPPRPVAARPAPAKRVDTSGPADRRVVVRFLLKVATFMLIGMVAAGFAFKGMCNAEGGATCSAIYPGGDPAAGLTTFFVFLTGLTVAALALVWLIVVRLSPTANTFEYARVWLTWAVVPGVGAFLFHLSRSAEQPVSWTVWVWMPLLEVAGFAAACFRYRQSR